jgi:hypothetical protein
MGGILSPAINKNDPSLASDRKPDYKSKLLSIGQGLYDFQLEIEALDFRLHETLEKVKTVSITMQRPCFSRWAILPAQLFYLQHPPVATDTPYYGSHASFCFQSDNLICVQPVGVVCLFELPVKSCPQERGVYLKILSEHFPL